MVSFFIRDNPLKRFKTGNFHSRRISRKKISKKSISYIIFKRREVYYSHMNTYNSIFSRFSE